MLLFQKAIIEQAEEWSDNRKLIDTSVRFQKTEQSENQWRNILWKTDTRDNYSTDQKPKKSRRNHIKQNNNNSNQSINLSIYKADYLTHRRLLCLFAFRFSLQGKGIRRCVPKELPYFHVEVTADTTDKHLWERDCLTDEKSRRKKELT